MATILVIDDEEAMRATVATYLHCRGHTVIEARNGREGLQSFASGFGDFDLVVCDLMLPELGGVETIKRLRARSPSLPILALSGATHALEYVRLNNDSSALECLAKPFTATGLMEAIDKLLPGSALVGNS